MALTHDTNLRIPATALTTTTGAASASYTCGANAKVLVVMVLYAGVTQRTGGSPTYNSVALTQAESLAGVTEASCELWYLINPPVSQSLTVNVPNGNGVTMWVYVASGNAAAGNTVEVDDTGITETTAANPSVSVTTTAAGTLIYACVATGDNTFAPSARTGTSLYEEDIAAYGGGAQYYVMAGTGTQALSWTEATSDDYGALAVAFKEVLATPSPSVSDAITVGESRTVAVPNLGNMQISDALTVTDSVQVEFPAELLEVTVQDDITLGEILGYREDSNAAVSDAITLGESLMYFTDAIMLGEALSIELVSEAVDLSINVSDALTAGESHAVAVPLLGAVAVSDAVTLGESLLRMLDMNVSKSDAVTLGETERDVEIPNLGGVNVTDGVTLGEIRQLEQNSFIDKSDALTIADSVNVVRTDISDFSISVTDAITLGESQSVAIPLLGGVNITDALTIGESRSVQIPVDYIGVSDGVTLADSVNVTRTDAGVQAISVTDALNLGESVTVAIPLLGNVNITDALTIGESLKVELNSFISKTDAVTLTDNVSVSLPIGINVSDSLTIGESRSLYETTSISVTDDLTLSETVQVVLPQAGVFSINVLDSLVLGEVRDQQLSISIAASDGITLTDTRVVHLQGVGALIQLYGELQFFTGTLTDDLEFSVAVTGDLEV